jgi:choline dehydrogenase
VTYLRQARPRPNLVIAPNSVVDRVLTQSGRATGISYLTADGRGETVFCDRIVVSCGVYGSPSILLRSGIGPEEEVRAHGIRQVESLPVGEGLRDHPQCLFEFHVDAASADMTGFIGATAARGPGWFAFPLAVDEEAGVCAIAYALTGQEPIGRLRLASSDPLQAPLINHNFQSVIDRAMFDDAWASFVDLLDSPSFRSVGARGGDLKRHPQEVLQERVGTAFHPTSTCAMGRVVDDHLAVIGVRGLWVADASVFPANVSTNTNLSCLMLGERAAELVRVGLES